MKTKLEQTFITRREFERIGLEEIASFPTYITVAKGEDMYILQRAIPISVLAPDDMYKVIDRYEVKK